MNHYWQWLIDQKYPKLYYNTEKWIVLIKCSYGAVRVWDGGMVQVEVIDE